MPYLWNLSQIIPLVLVDKPITSTFKEAQELDALAKLKDLILYPFQNRRYDSDYFALRSLLSLDKSSPDSLGDLVEFESQYVLSLDVLKMYSIRHNSFYSRRAQFRPLSQRPEGHMERRAKARSWTDL